MAAPSGPAIARASVTYCMSAQDTWDISLWPRRTATTSYFKIDIVENGATSTRMRPVLVSSCSQRCCLRARLLIYAGTKPSTESFIRAARRVPRAAICAVPPGRRTARTSFTAASSPSTLPSPRSVWSRNPNFEMYSTAWLPAYDSHGRTPRGHQDELRRRRRPACSSSMRASRHCSHSHAEGSDSGSILVSRTASRSWPARVIFTAFLDCTQPEARTPSIPSTVERRSVS